MLFSTMIYVLHYFPVLENCQISAQVILLAPTKSPVFLDIIVSCIFCRFCNAIQINTSAFITTFNLILKGNTIVVCSWLMQYFSELVDSIVASVLFRSLFYHWSRVLIARGMHISLVNTVQLIACRRSRQCRRSLPQKSKCFQHFWLVQSDITQNMKTSLCLQFNFLINLLFCYKFHMLL